MFSTFLHLTTKKTKEKEQHGASHGTMEIEEEEDVMVQSIILWKEQAAGRHRERDRGQ